MSERASDKVSVKGGACSESWGACEVGVSVLWETKGHLSSPKLQSKRNGQDPDSIVFTPRPSPSWWVMKEKPENVGLMWRHERLGAPGKSWYLSRKYIPGNLTTVAISLHRGEWPAGETWPAAGETKSPISDSLGRRDRNSELQLWEQCFWLLPMVPAVPWGRPCTPDIHTFSVR